MCMCVLWIYVLMCMSTHSICFLGGLTAVMWTDMVQTIIMLVGAIVLMIISLYIFYFYILFNSVNTAHFIIFASTEMCLIFIDVTLWKAGLYFSVKHLLFVSLSSLFYIWHKVLLHPLFAVRNLHIGFKKTHNFRQRYTVKYCILYA